MWPLAVSLTFIQLFWYVSTTAQCRAQWKKWSCSVPFWVISCFQVLLLAFSNGFWPFSGSICHHVTISGFSNLHSALLICINSPPVQHSMEKLLKNPDLDSHYACMRHLGVIYEQTIYHFKVIFLFKFQGYLNIYFGEPFRPPPNAMPLHYNFQLILQLLWIPHYCDLCWGFRKDGFLNNGQNKKNVSHEVDSPRQQKIWLCQVVSWKVQ